VIDLDTTSPAATEAAGAALAAHVRPGDIILLVGGLGAGKTTFVKGLAAALGFEGDVTSPTFTLSHVYDAGIRIVHADLWRLERVAEIEQLALDEEADSLIVVEWGEAAEELFGREALVVTIELGPDETHRLIHLDPVSHSWATRAGALERSLRPVP
jgi:tRNA threonylcarbamoyladenosine biosynthesis protein TsaE